MKLRVEGVELEATLPPENASADQARPVLVLECTSCKKKHQKHYAARTKKTMEVGSS